jgi:hypothetical protein
MGGRRPLRTLDALRACLPHIQAGTVNVQCRADGQATRAEITYDLTALRPTAQAGLRRFADGYDNFLKEWERLIATALEREPRPKGN